MFSETSHKPSLFNFVNMFRGSANYIANHRNTIVVYHIPGDLLSWDGFSDLMDDIALTWLLGIKPVIVVGCRRQIDERLLAMDGGGECSISSLSADGSHVECLEIQSSSSSNSSSRNDNDDKATSTDGSSGVGEEPSSGIQPSKSEDFSDMNNSSTSNTPIEAAVSKLSLKEGEKIHINLKATSSPSPSKNRTKRSSITGSGSKPPMLLRKPPPPASSTGTGAPVPLPPTSSSMPSSSSLPSKKVNVVINTDALKIQNDLHINNSNGGGSHSHQTDNSCVSSVAAVAETFEHDSDDEWGDFESPSFNED
mmetsp:Transcript_2996/g.4363  ORF Transcript_2996/g.4363 Transcript_2996/m.4363 type:complete len:309 (+) Transcript_2996:827-1753(+)